MRITYITPNKTRSTVTIPDYIYASLIEYIGSEKATRKVIRETIAILLANNEGGVCLSQTVAGVLTNLLISELEQEAQALRSERDALQVSLLGAASILLEGVHVG